MSEFLRSDIYLKQRQREQLAEVENGRPVHRPRRIRVESLIRPVKVVRDARSRVIAWVRGLRPDDESRGAAPALQDTDEPCWGC